MLWSQKCTHACIASLGEFVNAAVAPQLGEIEIYLFTSDQLLSNRWSSWIERYDIGCGEVDLITITRHHFANQQRGLLEGATRVATDSRSLGKEPSDELSISRSARNGPVQR